MVNGMSTYFLEAELTRLCAASQSVTVGRTDWLTCVSQRRHGRLAAVCAVNWLLWLLCGLQLLLLFRCFAGGCYAIRRTRVCSHRCTSAVAADALV